MRLMHSCELEVSSIGLTSLVRTGKKVNSSKKEILTSYSSDYVMLGYRYHGNRWYENGMNI